MNRKLSDEQIEAAWRSLRRTGVPVSGRALRAQLRRRFGAAGRTDRVFSLCRTLEAAAVLEQGAGGEYRDRATPAGAEPTWAADGKAEGTLREERDRALERARRSEAREIAHQDRWAEEVHALRCEVKGLRTERARRRLLEGQVLQLSSEVHRLRERLARASAQSAE